MIENAPPFYISNDHVGGNNPKLQEGYGPVLEHAEYGNVISGLEALHFTRAMLRAKPMNEKTNAAIGIPIVGIHAEPGINKSNRRFIYQASSYAITYLLMQDVGTSVNVAGSLPDCTYLLVHDTTVPTTESQSRLANHAQSANLALTVENEKHPAGLVNAVDAARNLNTMGVHDVSLTVDLFHLYVQDGIPQDSKQGWQTMKTHVMRLYENQDIDYMPIHFHLPLGPDFNDAFNYEDLTHEQWKDLAQLVTLANDRTGNTHVVLENKPTYAQLLYMAGLNRYDTFSERNLEIVRQIKDYDIAG